MGKKDAPGRAAPRVLGASDMEFQLLWLHRPSIVEWHGLPVRFRRNSPPQEARRFPRILTPHMIFWHN